MDCWVRAEDRPVGLNLSARGYLKSGVEGGSGLRTTAFASFFDEAAPNLVRVPARSGRFRFYDGVVEMLIADLICIRSA